MKHYSVLKQEVIEGLNINPEGVYVDATLGYGGHAVDILKRCKKGYLFAFDQDEEALHFSQERLAQVSLNFELIYANFVNLKEELTKRDVNEIDGIVFDLGFSSPQVDDETRGFSFMKEGPLDMRMDKNNELTAEKVVNTYSKEVLTDIFFKYGEERYSKSIAKNIVNKRPIKNTLELVEVIKASVPTKYFMTHHPERPIFQAIRIEVNNELQVLEKALEDAINLLKKGGRVCVISFHSLEDRITKTLFKKYSEVNQLVKGLPVIPDEYKPLIKLINKKPILPSKEELEVNSRSKSAKLRIIERI
jgi:16S rRNA (cytosine1402-N4)-methyltransferase